MLTKYLSVFFISMLSLDRAARRDPRGRGHGPAAVAGTSSPSSAICPVPFIFFARKVLEWGADAPVIGKFFTFCLEKATRAARS